jgi:hypothetical protein
MTAWCLSTVRPTGTMPARSDAACPPRWRTGTRWRQPTGRWKAPGSGARAVTRSTARSRRSIGKAGRRLSRQRAQRPRTRPRPARETGIDLQKLAGRAGSLRCLTPGCFPVAFRSHLDVRQREYLARYRAVRVSLRGGPAALCMRTTASNAGRIPALTTRRSSASCVTTAGPRRRNRATSPRNKASEAAVRPQAVRCLRS